MKMKEICAATGLTRRTIIFYEEQGLIKPEKILMNQREYRNYSESDVKALLDIAALRKCRFSIEEIKQMLSEDNTVRPIFASYKERLKNQQEELEILLQTIETIQEDKLHSVQDLLQIIQAPSKDLPIPETDCVPHFQHLDELEESLIPPKEPSKFHKDNQPISIDSDLMFVNATMGRKRFWMI